MDYIIENKLALVILNYLATRPYSEVHQLIQELQKMKEHEACCENKDRSFEVGVLG